jgi:hypothetical protein
MAVLGVLIEKVRARHGTSPAGRRTGLAIDKHVAELLLALY